MITERFDFENRNGQKLSARLQRPLGPARAFAVFAHCFTCSKNLNAVVQVTKALSEAGIAVLRFDFTGLGQSEGEFGATNFSSNIDDLRRACEVLEERHEAPQLLIGHSLGGAAVLHLAGELSHVRAVATIAAPSEPTHVRATLGDSVEEIEQRGVATVTLAGRPFTIEKQFLDDLEAHRMDGAIGKIKAALLVLHGPRDETVGIDNATQIFSKAKHPKSFVSLDDADHLLTRPEDAHYAGEVIAHWASRYLPEHAEVDAGDFQAYVEGPSKGYSTFMTLEGHPTIADEPKSVGGKELGPGPYGYLLGALGACTAMTLRMYADRKKIPLDRADVLLRHEKRHAKDCEEVGSKGAKLDHIDRELVLHGDLSDEQRERLLEIADKCPVHRTLNSEVVIGTKLRS